MAEIEERVITPQNGVVETETEYDDSFERVRTDDEVKDMVIELVHALESEIEVHRAILVGRYAKGCAWGWDDIEVGIVSPNFKGLNKNERMRLVSERVVSANVHPLVMVHGYFTPDEFLNGQIESLYGWGWRSGKMIYEKDAG